MTLNSPAPNGVCRVSYKTTWGASAIAGGAAAWLPNVLFMFLAWRLQDQTPAKGFGLISHCKETLT
jgi:F0F1-type ATP synthase assembly protein I